VYVGEAENVHKRLCDHLREYDGGKEPYYWNYAIVFVGGRLDKAMSIDHRRARLDCAVFS
jgi:hypothetical protein